LKSGGLENVLDFEMLVPVSNLKEGHHKILNITLGIRVNPFFTLLQGVGHTISTE
jgi:hypothetical protein